MSRNLIFNTAKQGIIALAENLTYDNADQFESQVKIYFDMIRLAHNLTETAPTIESEPIPEPIEELLIQTPSTGPVESRDPTGRMFVGQLHRVLIGGEVGSFKIYIPEAQIRGLNLEEGDWVRATVTETKLNQNNVERRMHRFELAGRSDEPVESNRRCLQFAVVKSEPTLHSLYIDGNYQGSLNVKIILDERNVNQFKIQEGDLVDYAYWADDLMSGKVSWLYPTELTESEIAKAVKAPVKKKARKTDEDKVEDKSEPTNEFEGVKVVAFAYENMKAQYRTAVEPLGGEFVFLTGDEPDSQIKREVQSANMVIVFNNFVSHKCMWYVKSLCKKEDIPVIYQKKTGMKSFIGLVRDNIHPVAISL
jgi:antitoxin component of MazEF toxin-antitoxin module